MGGTRWRKWLRYCAASRKVAGLILHISVAERSKARVCDCSLAGIAGSNPAGGMDGLCCVL